MRYGCIPELFARTLALPGGQHVNRPELGVPVPVAGKHRVTDNLVFVNGDQHSVAKRRQRLLQTATIVVGLKKGPDVRVGDGSGVGCNPGFGRNPVDATQIIMLCGPDDNTGTHVPPRISLCSATNAKEKRMPRPGEIIDITIQLREGMPQWAGEEIYQEEPLLRTPDDAVNVTRQTITTHTGTHVDAPRHFVHDGKTMDQIPLDRWVGPCVVVDLSNMERDITAEDLDQASVPPNTTRLVLKTRNSDHWSTHPDTFVENYVALTPSGARWLVERQIRLVAIDYLSIGSVGPEGTETHLELLRNDVLIVEGIDLRDVPAGFYELLCFPLHLAADGATARVALRALAP
jgi:arylformamidase